MDHHTHFGADIISNFFRRISPNSQYICSHPILHEYSNELHLLNLADGCSGNGGTLFHGVHEEGEAARCTELGNAICGTCVKSVRRYKT